MATTTYMEGLLLGHALLQQPFSFQNWYAGLWSNDPTDAGLLTNEISEIDYARVPVSWDANFTNDAPLVWSGATSSWGPVRYICLLNASVAGSGNILFYQTHSTIFLSAGQGLLIPTNTLTLTVD